MHISGIFTLLFLPESLATAFTVGSPCTSTAREVPQLAISGHYESGKLLSRRVPPTRHDPAGLHGPSSSHARSNSSTDEQLESLQLYMATLTPLVIPQNHPSPQVPFSPNSPSGSSKEEMPGPRLAALLAPKPSSPSRNMPLSSHVPPPSLDEPPNPRVPPSSHMLPSGHEPPELHDPSSSHSRVKSLTDEQWESLRQYMANMTPPPSPQNHLSPQVPSSLHVPFSSFDEPPNQRVPFGSHRVVPSSHDPFSPHIVPVGLDKAPSSQGPSSSREPRARHDASKPHSPSSSPNNKQWDKLRAELAALSPTSKTPSIPHVSSPEPLGEQGPAKTARLRRLNTLPRETKPGPSRIRRPKIPSASQEKTGHDANPVMQARRKRRPGAGRKPKKRPSVPADRTLWHVVMPNPEEQEGVRNLKTGTESYYRKISEGIDTKQAFDRKGKNLRFGSPHQSTAISRRQRRKIGSVGPAMYEERITVGHAGASNFPEWHRITPKQQHELPPDVGPWTIEDLRRNLLWQNHHFPSHQAGDKDSAYAKLDSHMRAMCNTEQCNIQTVPQGLWTLPEWSRHGAWVTSVKRGPGKG